MKEDIKKVTTLIWTRRKRRTKEPGLANMYGCWRITKYHTALSGVFLGKLEVSILSQESADYAFWRNIVSCTNLSLPPWIPEMNSLHPVGTSGSMCWRIVRKISWPFLKKPTFTFNQPLNPNLLAKSVILFVLFYCL